MAGWDEIFEHDTIIDPSPAFLAREAQAQEGAAPSRQPGTIAPPQSQPRAGVPTHVPRPRQRATAQPARQPATAAPARQLSSAAERARQRAAAAPVVARPISSRPPPRLVSSLRREDLSKRLPLDIPIPSMPSWQDAATAVRTGLLAPVLDRNLPPPTFPVRTPAGPLAIAVPREIDLEHVRALVWLAGAAVLIVAATVYILT